MKTTRRQGFRCVRVRQRAHRGACRAWPSAGFTPSPTGRCLTRSPYHGQLLRSLRHCPSPCPGAPAFRSRSPADPGDGLQFGVLADQGFGLAHKTCAIHFLVGQIARDAHQLFLALQQPQAHALLGVFHIALEGFVFAFDLFCPQIPESRHDGRHEQQHGSQRCQCSKTVLPGRREVAPPRTPPVRGGGQGGCRRGLVRDGGGVHRCQV